MNDLLFVEKRLERLDKEQKKKRDAQKTAMEADLLARMKNHLETGCFLKNFLLTETEEKLIAGYPLLTRKAMIIVLNIGEEAAEAEGLMGQLKEGFGQQDFQWIAVSAKIEQSFLILMRRTARPFLRNSSSTSPLWTD
ncbi:MAG: hypothetical protein FJ130_01015 [Deltaproteobacteria bacterium]|nr:hypothetical protein [Deltaproteobacteria bacterium]